MKTRVTLIAITLAFLISGLPQQAQTPPTDTSTTATTGSADASAASSTVSSAQSPAGTDATQRRTSTIHRSVARDTSTISVPRPVNAPPGQLNLLASISKRSLWVGIGKTPIKKYEVAIGSKAHPTPQGLFSIQHIVWNPSWRPPDAAWAKDKKPAGPGDPDNPMKVVKLFFQEPDYYIHGTDKEESLGAAASHGCLRMSQSDVARLARLVMERGGAPKTDAWFASVINGTSSADVRLPASIPFRIVQ